MALFKSPAEKAQARLQSSQNDARRKAIKNEMSVAEGSFNESIKNSKEAERKAQQEYKAALRTGDEEKIKSAIENMTKAEEATKQAKQEKTDGLSKMKQSYKDVGKLEQPEMPVEQAAEQTETPADVNKPAKQTKKPEQPEKSANTNRSVSSGSDPVRDTVRGSRLSASFYRDLSAGLKNRPGGNIADAKAATAGAQAQVAQNASAKRGMEAQQHQQIANQNAFAEAGKIASVQNDAENRQRVANAGAAAGNAAARLRRTNVPDVQSQLARQDTQRSQADTQREKEDEMEGEVAANIGLEKQYRIGSRDYDKDLDTSERLSMGEGAKEEPFETAESESEPEPKPEQSAESEPEQPAESVPESISGNPQHVLNYITYGNDPTSKNYQQKAMSDNDKKLWEAWGKPEPLTEQDVINVQGGFNGNIGQLQQVVKDKRPEFYQKYVKSDLGKSRGIDTAHQKNIGSGLTQEELDKASTTVESDVRVKNVQKALSDCRMKYILEDYNSGRGITPDDFMWLARQMGGKFTHNDREYDFFNDDDWNDDDDGSVLKGYAEHIRNYLYTYKPEATEIDSSIDPDEEHIGPMAQDIEMVNPACVKETSEGVKTVDTARLAMMNAGAIGDLARQMQELTDKLKELGL